MDPRALGAALAVTLAVTTFASATVTDPRHFRANDTLLGAPVPCSDSERACFRYNRLLDPASGKCYRVGSRGPCVDGAFLLDRREFASGSGRLVGVCRDPGKCPDHRFRMAFDGKCYTGKEVFGTFCDVRTGSSGWPYFFGGYECVCEGTDCPTPRYVDQRDEPNKCFFPNFRKDLTSNFFPRLPTGNLECSPNHDRCFTRGEVAFGVDERCYKLLEQGPCPEGQLLVLDKQQAQENHKLSAVCAPVARCPVDTKFMTHMQGCVKESDIQNILCPDLNVFTDIFGETVCRFKEEYYEMVLKSVGDSQCELKYNVRLTGLKEPPKPVCSSSDPLDCLLLEEFDPDILMSSLGDS